MNIAKMNTKSLAAKMGATALVALTFIVCASTAVAGTKDGGGGNAQPSTRADLEEFVANIGPRQFWEISDAYLVGEKIQMTSSPLKPELAEITGKILGLPVFTINDSIKDYLKNLKFEIVDGPCFDGDEEKDASTPYEKNATICLSASRLARFPKSALRVALLPLMFHEVAHQFGFGENQANAFQKLADLHLKYRTIYLSALRARFQCALASRSLTEKQKREVLREIPIKFSGEVMRAWPKLTGAKAQQVELSCAVQAASTAENLARIYDGDFWQQLTTATLSKREQATLLAYDRDQKFTFVTLTRALKEPSNTGYNEHVDPAYLMMLGAKAALEHIDHEVGRLQDEILVK